MKAESTPASPGATAIATAHTVDAARVGRYRLCFEIASGGMASVYLARTEGPSGFDKLVALKRIHPHLAHQPEFVEMFLDEARIASRINHANVCSVFDFGRASDAEESYFIAMELLLGESVSRIFRAVAARGEDQDWARVARLSARIVADACEGLHAAHELRGEDGRPLAIIHRDVSPQNLFVTYDGIAKVVDFGVASAVGKLHHTLTGAVKGKLPYMAPEQARRQPIDRRADVWSLGVVLWELVTGKRLFRFESEVDTVVAVLNQPAPQPSRVRPGVPPALDAIVLGALERDAALRTATARQLGQDLQAFLVQQGASVGPAEVAEWMRELFPEELARRQELVEQARRARTGVVPKISALLAGEQALPEPAGPDRPELSGVPTIRLMPPRRPWPRRWRIAVAAAAVVGFLGVVGAHRTRSAPAAGTEPAAEPETQAADEPQAAAEPEAETETKTEPATEPAAEPAPEAATEAEASPAPRRRPTRPAGPPGRVNVAAVGSWADIFVAGRPMGRTPAQLTLAPGRHVIELRPSGGRPARRQTVVVPAGGATRVSVQL